MGLAGGLATNGYLAASTSGVPTVINVLDRAYGAKGDGQTFSDGVITSGQATLNSATANFKATDVGKLINIWAAGAAGALLSTTIIARNSATQVTLNTTAGNSIAANGVFCFGTDDSTAFTTALAAAHTAGGGVVYVPQVSGTYCVNVQLDVGDDVWFKGGGRTGTRLTWMSDLGGATSGIRTGPNSTQPPGTQSGCNYSLVSDLEIVGPGNQNCALGVQPCAMRGVALRSNGRMVQCNAYGWYAGACFSSNHEQINDCRLSANYYGIMWDILYTDGTFGNQSIEDSEIVVNKFASLYVHGDSKISSCFFANMHLGFGPYGIYKDNNGTDSSAFLDTTTFLNVAFEAIGNRMIYDKAKNKNINTCFMQLSGGSIFNNTYNYATDGTADFCVVTSGWFDCTIVGIGFANPGGGGGGASGFFDVDSAQNLKFLDGEWMVSQSSNSKPVFKAANDCHGVDVWRRNGVRCQVRKTGGASNLAANDFVYICGGTNFRGVSKDSSGSGGSDIPVGVCQVAANTGTNAVIAVEGEVSINSGASTVTGAANYISADTANRGQVKAGLVTDGGIIVGIGGPSSGGFTPVMLRTGG